MKLQLTDDSKQMFEGARGEPYNSINKKNQITVDSFLYMLHNTDSFVQQFEEDIGMNGAREWIGERLNEAADSGGIKTVKDHLTYSYYSRWEPETDSAYILMENYELSEEGAKNGLYYLHNYTTPAYMIIRRVHEDVHSHFRKTEYSQLFSELRKETVDKMKERKLQKLKIADLPLELSAVYYIGQIEEELAIELQGLATDAFLAEYYNQNPEQCRQLRTPLFLPPNLGIVEEMRRIIPYEVIFENGYLDKENFKAILDEYVNNLLSKTDILENARIYLHSGIDYLINVTKECLDGDYSGLERSLEQEEIVLHIEKS